MFSQKALRPKQTKKVEHIHIFDTVWLSALWKIKNNDCDKWEIQLFVILCNLK